MALKIGILLAAPKDTTATNCSLALIEEARLRGHEVWHFEPSHLSLLGRKVSASAAPVHVNLADPARFIWTEEAERRRIDLHGLDAVLIRQDPVFDMSFVTSTYILEYLAEEIPVLNAPSAIRNFPEKLAMFGLDDLRPPTLVTADYDALYAFWEAQGDIILKPLYAYGGEGVFRVSDNPENLRSLAETLVRHYGCPFVAQRYIPAVRQGDTRAVILFGELESVVTRVPAERELRANMKSGATATLGTLTERELDACRRIGPELMRHGIVYAGLDFIGGYVTEINVTTPGGLLQSRDVAGSRPERIFWDKLERLIENGGRIPLPEGAFNIAAGRPV